VVDFYPVPHRDRAEPPPARERSDPSRAVRRDRGRTGRADPTDPGGPPAGWWHSFRDGLPNPYEVYTGLEAGSASIRNFERVVAPGLQTAGYARETFRNGR